MVIREICEATGGAFKGSENIKDLQVTAFSTDSRKDVKGCLFIPIAGPNFDGHDYIADVLSSGAVCALTEREDTAEPCIKVSSTRRALIALAMWKRDRFNGPVIAVTGSVGKTTTKEIIAAVTSEKYNTLKTIGNYNNDIGLPLSLLRQKPEHEAFVLEMGMNHSGEIRVLSNIGKPNICLITNIGDAHIENLGSREGILRAKSEIFEGMQDGGTVILNGNDPLLAKLPKVAAAKNTIYCFTDGDMPYTDKSGCHIIAKLIKDNGLLGTECLISGVVNQAEVGEHTLNIPIPGKHMLMNVAMAFAVGVTIGISPEAVKKGISAYIPPDGRMDIQKIRGMTLINDCYNASTASVKAAIDILSNIKESRRRVCILSDMLELGDFGEALHKEIGYYAASKDIDLLIAIGPLSRHIYDVFIAKATPDRALYFEAKEGFDWKSRLCEGDSVLIKASRGMGLDTLVKSILSEE